MNIHHIGMYLIPLCSWNGAENPLLDRIGMGYLVLEEYAIKSKGTSIDTSPLTEANPMDIYHVGTYLIPLCTWEHTEQYGGDRIEIRCLAVEESGVKSKHARKCLCLYC